jgi:ATP-dependent Clp protease protease subunit
MRIDRKIIISQPINDDMAGEIIAQIIEINDTDEHYGNSVIGYTPEPIEMFINSGGGSATAGNAIIGAMEMSETPIITYGMGIVASMALAIFVAGDIRMAHRFCRFMYHSVAYGADGHIQDHEDGLKEGKLIQEMYDSLFLSRTRFSKELMAEILKEKSNFFFSAKKALKLGVTDDIIALPDSKFEDEEIEELEEVEELDTIEE